MRSFAVLLSLCLSLTTLADGKVFPRTTQVAAAPIPDQQALLSYSHGVETLVIETRFDAGAGSEFAWIVPTPSRPDVSAGTAGTFPSLRAIFAPWVRSFDWLFPACALTALLLFIAIETLFWSPRQRIKAFLALFGLLFLGGFCLLPTLGRARGVSSAPASAGVQVHERKVVGAYDVAVLSGEDAASLTSWLTDHGFPVPPEDQPTIAAYIQEGWCFVASRLRRDDTGESLTTPHPLVLRFPTPTPIYPMRLTAHGMDESLELDLYVFGPGTARAPGMDVVATDRVVRMSGGLVSPSRNGYEVAHSTLESLTAGTPHVTLLRGAIKAEDMTTDLDVAFDGPLTKRPWFVTGETALWASLLTTLLGALVASLAYLVHFRGMAPRDRLARTSLTLLAVAIAVGGLTFAAMPRVATMSVPFRWRAAERALDVAAYSMMGGPAARDGPVSEPTSLDEVRRRVAEGFQPMKNAPTEGDGPGQYRLEAEGTNVYFLYVDTHGRERRDWIGTLAASVN